MTFTKLALALESKMTANANNRFALRRQLSTAIGNRSIRARVTLLDSPNESGQTHNIEVKELDGRGITFDHPLPLSNRRAIVALESPQLGRLVAEVDLTWCRFNHTGRYTSGGRFVQLIGKTA